MRALQRKLKSRGGATLLMAMLLMLVAMMVSAVIISAANTSAKSLRARRDSEQAYQTCSSAAIYLRDALVNDQSPYKITITQDNSVATNPTETKKGPDARNSNDIVALVDDLLNQVMAGNSTSELFKDDKVPTSTYTFQADGMDPVKVTLTLQLDDKNLLDGERTYLLTADCELESSTSALCHLMLQMRCGIQKSINNDINNKKDTITYTAAWPLNCAVIQRQGLGGAS